MNKCGAKKVPLNISTVSDIETSARSVNYTRFLGTMIRVLVFLVSHGAKEKNT
jgi:hypothetical protein